MSATPIASFSKSKLRSPDLVAMAKQGPVEIRLGGSEDPLYLVPGASLRTHARVQQLVELFVRTVVELMRDDPSPAILGEVSYVARWQRSERERFVEGFAEAINESLRADDPAPAEAFVRVMATAGRTATRRELTGVLSDAAEQALADRLDR